MMFWNSLLVALREIRHNVMRSFLTVLGIVIGVAAVITMVTVGEGAAAHVTSQIESLGTNLLILRPGQRLGPGTASTAPSFDREDAEVIEREVRGVLAVAPQSSRGSVAVAASRNWSSIVTGSTSGFFEVRDWPLSQGRRFTAGELRAGTAVCILGQTVVRELFAARSPEGEIVRLGKLGCTVIGVLAAKGQSPMGTDQDNLVLMPLRTFQRRVAGSTSVSMIQIAVQPGSSTSRVKRDIERLMRERRRIGPTEDDDFSVLDTRELADTLSGTTRVLTLLLGSVAGVSLLVGGIGIMNIMLVSVTERTREIGIRLAIGALEREVLMQFLVESGVLSSLGGAFGIVLALGLSRVLTGVMGVPFLPSARVIGVAFGFAAGVGLLFGYFPARRAARLDPIDALRHE